MITLVTDNHKKEVTKNQAVIFPRSSREKKYPQMRGQAISEVAFLETDPNTGIRLKCGFDYFMCKELCVLLKISHQLLLLPSHHI